jgi:hypothetical protein
MSRYGQRFRTCRAAVFDPTFADTATVLELRALSVAVTA